MKKVKAVIFDFNGTLFFDAEYHYQAWEQIVYELLGTSISEDVIRKLHGHNNRDILYMIQPNMTEKENENISKRKEQLYRTICLSQPHSVELVKGAIEIFEVLQDKGIPFTIASASIKENIDFFVEIFSLEKWVTKENIIYDNGKYKNKVKMFQDACQLLMVDSADCLVVEDSHIGIQAAQKAGIQTIIGIQPKGDYEALYQLGTDTCIRDFTEFPMRYF